MISFEIPSPNMFPVDAFKVESSLPDGRTPKATTIAAPAGGRGAKNGIPSWQLNNNIQFLNLSL